jgi:hypothetical protein
MGSIGMMLVFMPSFTKTGSGIQKFIIDILYRQTGTGRRQNERTSEKWAKLRKRRKCTKY